MLSEIKRLQRQLTGFNGPKRPTTDIQDNPPGDIILGYLSTFLQQSEDSTEIHRLKADMETAFAKPPAQRLAEPWLARPHMKEYEIPESREAMLQAYFIESLRYQEMEYREAHVSDAHQETFRWLFDGGKSDLQFTDWLESDSKLYWITGKAGSGKSTLMKFIDRYGRQPDGRSRTREHLAVWAGHTTLITASFYFWASGTSMENSQKGLFTTLLFQIFSLRPDIIPDVLPEDWEWACLFGRSSALPQWSEAELRRMFYDTVTALTTLRTFKLCLLIDGLDEFDGDPWDIVRFTRRLKDLPNIKLCVSSRPWLVFEDAFKQQPSLMLQDITGSDIERFVRSKFEGDDGFKRLQQRDAEYASRFLGNITEKSSGVFLWVEIVVSSLLAGLSQDDRISDLQRRLDALPADLEKLYIAILDQLDPYYFQHASQYFIMTLESRLPPVALAFLYADDESPETALQMQVAPTSGDENLSRISTLRRRLNSRCKGLLEVGPGHRVQYLHRTVRDYLNNEDTRTKLQKAAGDFDSHLRFCCGYLSLLKTLDSQVTNPVPFVKFCLESAGKAKQNGGMVIKLVDCLREVIPLVASADQAHDIYNALPDEHSISPWVSQPHYASFLALAVRHGVEPYVSARIRRPNMPRNELKIFAKCQHAKFERFKKSLFAKEPLTDIQDPRTEPSSLFLDANFAYPPKVGIYRAIFDAGGQHSLNIGDGTPWVAFLTAMIGAAIHTSGTDAWAPLAPILELFVERGARLNKKTVKLAMENISFNMNLLDADKAHRALVLARNGHDERGLQELRQSIEGSV
jgi:hypothetical protein